MKYRKKQVFIAIAMNRYIVIATDSFIQEFLSTPKKIAIVGASSKSYRTSNQMYKFLKKKGNTLIPIHPSTTQIEGDKVLPNLNVLQEQVDAVMIYLRTKLAQEQVQLAISKQIPFIWLPEGVFSELGRTTAETTELVFAEDRCPLKEWMRLVK